MFEEDEERGGRLCIEHPKKTLEEPYLEEDSYTKRLLGGKETCQRMVTGHNCRFETLTANCSDDWSTTKKMELPISEIDKLQKEFKTVVSSCQFS